MTRTAEEQVADVLRAAGVDPSGLAGERSGHGMSGDLVFRIDAPIAAFAKVSLGDRRISRQEMAREIAVLAWMGGQHGAPKLLWSGEIDGQPGLLMEALSGIALHELEDEAARAGAIAAIQAMARLHALPIGECPFDERLERKLAEARRRIDGGELAEGDFDPERKGLTAEDVWAQLMARRPAEEDLVVTHGDASWPNFIPRRDGACGLIDLGRAGVADRYQDLAIFLRSGRRNAPELDVAALVLAHYPLDRLDEAKLEFYRILDEAF